MLTQDEVLNYDKWYKKDQMYCYSCERDTLHWICRVSTHERDCSDDWWACCECLKEYNGYTGEYS